MKKARIIIGANYGDEGKGTVVAHYTKNSDNVLNILTNGGPQRGHSVLTRFGSNTFQHFGSGTYHGADSYYSCFFILNPMQFVKEYESLIVKPENIYRDRRCRWTTPYDIMANLITEELQKRHASCGMGIWNTVKRCNSTPIVLFDEFLEDEDRFLYLDSIKKYYERFLTIPSGKWRELWDNPIIKNHFIEDCEFMRAHTKVIGIEELSYDNLIFENGQGLLLSDTGKDTLDTTPSNTGIYYALNILDNIKDVDIEAHYVTRPYLTRHGDGNLLNEADKKLISSGIQEDRTNHFNEHQGEFRYGKLDIPSLKERIVADSRGVKTTLEITHCDEMDRVDEFRSNFNSIHTFDNPNV